MFRTGIAERNESHVLCPTFFSVSLAVFLTINEHDVGFEVITAVVLKVHEHPQRAEVVP
jgi:hypothetical protein